MEFPLANSDHHTISERLSKRALQLVLARGVTAAVLRTRARQEERFSGVHDWRRLILLGGLLIDMSLVGIAAPSLMLTLAGYWPGLAGTFGGLVIGIIMIKLSRPGIYWDWTMLGAIQVGLGIVLKTSPYLARSQDTTVFFGLLLIVALLLLWIGATTRQSTGRAWIGAGGLAVLLITVFGLIDHIAIGLLRPEVVVLTTMTLIGVSVFGFGISLRPKMKK
jgi:hypothetical protein